MRFKNVNYISTNISLIKMFWQRMIKNQQWVFKKLASIDSKHTFILQNTHKEGQRLNQYRTYSYLSRENGTCNVADSQPGDIWKSKETILGVAKKKIAIRMALGEQIPCMLNAFVVEDSQLYSQWGQCWA